MCKTLLLWAYIKSFWTYWDMYQPLTALLFSNLQLALLTSLLAQIVSHRRIKKKKDTEPIRKILVSTLWNYSLTIKIMFQILTQHIYKHNMIDKSKMDTFFFLSSNSCKCVECISFSNNWLPDQRKIMTEICMKAMYTEI